MLEYRVLVFPSETPGAWFARCFELGWGVQIESPFAALQVIKQLLPRRLQLHFESGKDESEFEPLAENDTEVVAFNLLGESGERQHRFVLAGHERLMRVRFAPSRIRSPVATE